LRPSGELPQPPSTLKTPSGNLDRDRAGMLGGTCSARFLNTSDSGMTGNAGGELKSPLCGRSVSVHTIEIPDARWGEMQGEMGWGERGGKE